MLECRDDTIFCLLPAKDAIGDKPRLNEDILDIQGRYFDRGDVFYIAVDDNDRIVGMLGTLTVSGADLWLKRLYVKPCMKQKGVAGALLATVETFAKAKGFFDDEMSDGLRHTVKYL